MSLVDGRQDVLQSTFHGRFQFGPNGAYRSLYFSWPVLIVALIVSWPAFISSRPVLIGVLICSWPAFVVASILTFLFS